jgi:hypothetical protein
LQREGRLPDAIQLTDFIGGRSSHSKPIILVSLSFQILIISIYPQKYPHIFEATGYSALLFNHFFYFLVFYS